MQPRNPIIKLLCIVVVATLALWVGLHGARRVHELQFRELQRRLICASYLKGIGTSAKIYANIWDGTTPIIDWLVKTGDIDAKSTKCPGTDSPNYVVDIATLVSAKDGRALDNRMVIAYEPKSNHGGEGGNVLYADGHVEFVRVPAYDELVSTVTKANP